MRRRRSACRSVSGGAPGYATGPAEPDVPGRPEPPAPRAGEGTASDGAGPPAAPVAFLGFVGFTDIVSDRSRFRGVLTPCREPCIVAGRAGVARITCSGRPAEVTGR
ncbi:hypothetical protein SCA03_27790 [Streptomyces cacaoi]|uniref:Uncharacterized protein n=1 Tax=Streptomyces cacaoi TaxID=1898 RepID=A0A4Y3R0M7_STRCI|nr:hypothetical protein SCA03_27790 [Streptomyces cacaoi]